ncbi:hypothetical protein NDU88_003694 [Pleurodeles waltl]|uniref:Laminin G domain-containing protein n=2 Tax=Pleurodeles waltl TaxID=8319 RepID=A0AAV7LHT2_PLEWA|nr:hypothetical protein NDU88_003694 [Pleurodeles waltl]
MVAERVTLVVFILLLHRHLSEGSVVKPNLDPQKGTCILDAARSANELYLGNEDKNILLMVFPLSKLTSYLSSFDFRTFDSEGVIFYGDIGGDYNWFVLALRDKHLEVQMTNENGQMLLSMFGPNMSDGKWRKVSVDRNANIIEVRVDGEVVVSLMHYVKSSFSGHADWKLRILIGDLPLNSSVQLLRPLNPSLDGCMRDWSWVQEEANVLTSVMESSEHKRCFEQEESGTYFPGDGFAEFQVASFGPDKGDGENSTVWSLTAKLLFRPVVFSGILFSIHGENQTIALSLAMDKMKQVFTVSLLDKVFSSDQIPLDHCQSTWTQARLTIQNNQLQLKTSMAQSEYPLSDKHVRSLENIWQQPTTTIYIGGTPGLATEESYFTGCLKMALQGKMVEFDEAKNKHGHIRSHSCPTAIHAEESSNL